MFHVYILRSESTGGYYVGSTGHLERRLLEHNANLATATKNRGPWKLIYQEGHPDRGAAMKRERYFKTGRGREEFRRITKENEAVSSMDRGRRGDTLNQ